jgi:DNA-binding CsgD family transcriptional regulator
MGRRIHRRTRAGDLEQGGVASLTEPELQIAMLIVDRKTNGEIAAEPQQETVETHIRNMFRKLDANSRVDHSLTHVEKYNHLLFFVAGNGEITTGERTWPLSPESYAKVKAGEEHSLRKSESRGLDSRCS